MTKIQKNNFSAIEILKKVNNSSNMSDYFLSVQYRKWIDWQEYNKLNLEISIFKIYRIITILMFLGRDLSRENLRKQMNHPTSLRACTSEKRIMTAAPDPGLSSVGPYRFKEQDLIGKGFSSRVYKAYHSQREDQIFAIKVINLAKFKSSNLAMLQNEIEVHRIINHPNLVKFYDAYKTQNFYYIITEYCPHGDLSALLNHKKKLQESKAKEIMCQIISGYLYMAKKGILHRDLKPANIMRHGNTWKIGDFGFATSCKTDFFFDKLNVGTPLYMPPQSLRTNKYSFKSDVFALGIMLYEMLIGKTPWDCKTEKELIQKMNREKIRFPTNTTEEIKAFIEKACQINEYQRMSRNELTEFLQKHSSSNPEESSQAKTQESQTNSISDNNKLSLRNCGSTPKLNVINSNPKTLEKNQSCKALRNDQESTSISSDNSERQQKVLKIGPFKNSRPVSAVKKISNTEFLLRELQFCRLIYYMIKNIKYFPISDPSNKSFVELILFKHLLRCIKHLEDPAQHFSDQLVGFAQYKGSKDYQNLEKEIKNYVNRYQKQYLETLKNADIVVIRSVNRRFPELSYTSAFTKKFYEQFYQYFCGIIRECNHSIASNISNISPAQIQAIQSLFTYVEIVEQKSQLKSAPEKNQRKSSLSGLGSKIVMDYTRSKYTKDSYQELRKKIKHL